MTWSSSAPGRGVDLRLRAQVDEPSRTRRACPSSKSHAESNRPASPQRRTSDLTAQPDLPSASTTASASASADQLLAFACPPFALAAALRSASTRTAGRFAPWIGGCPATTYVRILLTSCAAANLRSARTASAISAGLQHHAGTGTVQTHLSSQRDELVDPAQVATTLEERREEHVEHRQLAAVGLGVVEQLVRQEGAGVLDAVEVVGEAESGTGALDDPHHLLRLLPRRNRVQNSRKSASLLR